jgi:hypothetical protein
MAKNQGWITAILDWDLGWRSVITIADHDGRLAPEDARAIAKEPATTREHTNPKLDTDNPKLETRD